MLIDDFRPSDKRPTQRESLKKNTEYFQTPAEVAATDTIERSATIPPESFKEGDAIKTNFNPPNRSQGKWHRFALHKPHGKKQWAMVCATLLLIGIGAFLLITHNTTKPVAIVKHKIVAKPKPTTVASRLSGVQVSPALAKLPVTGVMIENSDQARPQSGLSQAGVVYEAIAEGGITRFLALFEEGQPSSIGPIRSARPYYIDQLLPFDAGYAHVGGSPDALSEIPTLNVKDMNQYSNGGSYSRVASRASPHNVYASMASLVSLQQSKGWTTSNFVGFPRKVDSPAKTPTATKIDLSISYADMNSHYQYDPALNSYLRSEAGAPMVDANSNKQLEAKVVIALVIPWTYGVLDASGARYTDYSDIGSAAAYIFQDGTVTQGVWQKASPASQIHFNTAAGTAIPLNAGQTWITAIGKASQVTFSP